MTPTDVGLSEPWRSKDPERKLLSTEKEQKLQSSPPKPPQPPGKSVAGLVPKLHPWLQAPQLLIQALEDSTHYVVPTKLFMYNEWAQKELSHVAPQLTWWP